MRIIAFERWDKHHSVGAASGEGRTFGFLANNADGFIEHWFEKVDGEWVVDPSPAPVFLQTLVAVRVADEQWKRGEVEMPTVAIAAEP
jgi:hypothetical protein